MIDFCLDSSHILEFFRHINIIKHCINIHKKGIYIYDFPNLNDLCITYIHKLVNVILRLFKISHHFSKSFCVYRQQKTKDT